MTVKRMLDAYKSKHNIVGKGSLSVVLQLTRMFSKDNLPINTFDYVTEREGQVKGLGGANLKSILSDYGINRTLSREGGRTSRGSMGIMSSYVAFINSLPAPVDFEEIEQYWIRQIQIFFASKPFKLNADSSKSLTSCINELFAQARVRERENPGTTYTGTVLQHLVAAKLSLILPDIAINGADVADLPTGRAGDFMVGDVAVHCTTAPGGPLMEKCAENIKSGIRPVVITISERTATARDLSEDAGISERMEIWDVQQFLSTNVYEHGLFEQTARTETVARIVEEYNAIVGECESDPSLRIEFS